MNRLLFQSGENAARGGRYHTRFFDSIWEAMGTRREILLTGTVAVSVAIACVFFAVRLRDESAGRTVLTPGAQFVVRAVRLADPSGAAPRAEASRAESKPMRKLEEQAGRAVSAQLQDAGAFGEATTADGIGRYREELLAHIQDNMRYPEEARGLGLRGNVWMQFTLTGDGGLEDLRILRGSGSPVLDGEAIETIMRAVPMPKVPPHMSRQFKVRLDFVTP